MSNPLVPAVEATIKLGAGVSIDGYMMPSAEVRYGLEYVSLLLGYGENYFRRQLRALQRTKKPSKKLKALLGKGFTAYLIPVKVARDGKRGATTPLTISFDDLCLLMDHEAAEVGNPKAIALFSASFRELLRSRTQDAFGIAQDPLEKKQLDFQESYESYLQREEVLQDNRDDVEALALPGDDDGYELIDEWSIQIAPINAYWEELCGEPILN